MNNYSKTGNLLDPRGSRMYFSRSPNLPLALCDPDLWPPDPKVDPSCACPAYNHKKYVLSNSESVQCNFFIFDHVTFIEFKICCCVQNFIESGWFFAEIWRYNDFQNGGRPPPWNCFTTIWDHPRSFCCWPQLPVKFHVNLIHRSEDIAIWIFRIFGLKCLFKPQNGGFEGLSTPKSIKTPKRHILA